MTLALARSCASERAGTCDCSSRADAGLFWVPVMAVLSFLTLARG
ncbi:hypothetical protein [Saccharopolyspora mangrovi]|uniref:Uncharacterized protein n=1 Tax=Saccharopolyspora mangrovi TaxID=3082379 RepID=A0ABU6AL76_9PSEU|nr:hypothetical protein [Saccharopolyspora sp. S2-29]MEB3372265.1 hypothetical protein [Saccharopolyspora sp. S2-29]